MNASVGVAFAEGANSFIGAVTSGTERVFGQGGVNITNYSDLNASAVGFTGLLGTEIVGDAAKKVRVCPLGGFIYQSGPDIGATDTSLFGLMFGARIGVLASESPSVSVIPTFGASFQHARVSLTNSGGSITVNDAFGAIDFGVGILLNQRVSILPLVSIPFGLEDGSDPAFSISATFGFGKR